MKRGLISWLILSLSTLNWNSSAQEEARKWINIPSQIPELQSYIPKGENVEEANLKYADSNGDRIIDYREFSVRTFKDETITEKVVVHGIFDGKISRYPYGIQETKYSDVEVNGKKRRRIEKKEQYDFGKRKVATKHQLPNAWADYEPDGTFDLETSITIEFNKAKTMRRIIPQIPMTTPNLKGVQT